MTIKKQFETLKDNWLLLAIGAVLVVLFLGMGNVGSFSESISSNQAYYGGVGMAESMAYDSSIRYYPGSDSYNPEIENRIKIKSASMSVETKTNEFDAAEAQLKGYVTNYDADITSENVRNNGKGIGAYKTGSFTIKVSTIQYESLVSDLETIGQVTSFNENMQDVTESYLNTQDQLDLEQEKLDRYQSLYDEAETIEDKLNLEDRVANQERTIKYLTQQLENTDSRVEYTTVSVNLKEEQSSFANISLLKFGDWVRNLVTSLNVLFYLIAWAIPFALAIGIIVFIKRRL